VEIPSNSDCQFTFPFSGITSETLVHTLKVRVDDDNGSFNGDIVSGNVELDSLKGQIDMFYRIRDKVIEFYVTKKGDFVDCKTIAEIIRQMVDEAVLSAKNDPNPRIMEFVDDEDEADGGYADVEDEDEDDDEVEIEAPPARPAPSPLHSPRPASQQRFAARPTPTAAPARQIQSLRGALDAEPNGEKGRKLLILSAVVIVSALGFYLMGRAPKET
jgi:hypothetical protein